MNVLYFLTALLLLISCKTGNTPTPGNADPVSPPSEANLQLAWQYAQQAGSQTMLVMHDGATEFLSRLFRGRPDGE